MTEIIEGVVVSKLPISDLIFIFIAYLAIHIMIALLYKSKEKKLNALKAISTEPSDKLIEEEKQTKILKYLYKWFPAVVVIVIIIRFYS